MKIDFSKPLSDTDIARLSHIFKKIPSYSDEGFIRAFDIGKLIGEMDWDRTPEQIEAYVDYSNKYAGGLFTFSSFTNVLKSVHENSKIAKTVATTFFDRDGNGFIDEDELKIFMEFMKAHDPKLQDISYAEFVREADTNNDGKVSIEEFSMWIKKFDKK